jgi:hypothetical protein
MACCERDTRAQDLRLEPRASRTPNSRPTPASAQVKTGVMGVWRLLTATGAATAKPTIPPMKAPRRSASESHWSLARMTTAAPTPSTPPTTAPAKSPRFPAPWPRTEPITAPIPVRAQVAKKAGMGVAEVISVRSKVVCSPSGSRLSCGRHAHGRKRSGRTSVPARAQTPCFPESDRPPASSAC